MNNPAHFLGIKGLRQDIVPAKVQNFGPEALVGIWGRHNERRRQALLFRECQQIFQLPSGRSASHRIAESCAFLMYPNAWRQVVECMTFAGEGIRLRIPDSAAALTGEAETTRTFFIPEMQRE